MKRAGRTATSPRRAAWWLRAAVLCAAAATSAVIGAGPAGLAAQAVQPRISGRVVDLGTGAGVEGAAIVLVGLRTEGADSIRVETVTDGTGMFQVQRAAAGEYELAVSHIAYGTFRERLTLVPGNRIALRVTLSPTAIALDPIVVEAASDADRGDRARGTALHRVTAEQLAPVARTGTHLANALAQLLPGIRVRSGRSQPGQLVCLEFRSPVTLFQAGCLTPVVVVDNVQQANPLITLNTIPISDIRTVEAVGPGEAGVRYGTNSSYGVILIETFSGAASQRVSGEIPDGIYNWALESEPYPWAKAFTAAAAANAASLLAGYALSRSCLSFDGLSQHFYESKCGFLGNTGSRLALYAAPQFGVGFVVRRVGATDLSRGSTWKNAVAGAIMATPGVVLALTSEEDGFGGSRGIGIFMATVGAPAAVVLANRVFRRVRR